LNTILDYDAVLVMDNGNIREFAPPQELLSDPTSLFYSMAVNARIIAKN
jgi:ATP-binding cassette subfamily C (CFTR/MRP) protein 1